jgi:uncharacterized protein YjiS (DUF1127 family)
MSGFGWYIERRARLKVYQAKRRSLEALSDNDLADIGVKRYQLGHIARVESLK